MPGYQTIANYESSPGVSIILHVNNTGGNSEDVIAESYDRALAILRNP